VPTSKIKGNFKDSNIQGIGVAGKVAIANLNIYYRTEDKLTSANKSGETIPPCPYPGLAYFGPGDTDKFFGRDATIARLEKTVGRQSFTALVGPSGSGKSSVVLAGLAPLMHQTGDWRFSYFRVGTEIDYNPFVSMARALVPLYVNSEDDTERLINTKKLAANLQTGDLTLRDVFADCRNYDKSRKILLIADQFEEVFTVIDDESIRHRFIDVLLAGFPEKFSGKQPDVCLIVTLRGDFYGQALQYRPFADALQGHVDNLGPMNRDELQAAIDRPAKRAGVSFEPGLVETLLDNVEGKPGSLPLLQFALREMWWQQENWIITWKSYRKIGGVQGALAQRAEMIYLEFSRNDANSEMDIAFRRLFTRLVMLGEGQEHTRRVVERQELGDIIWKLAQRLASEDNRLVVTNTLSSERETVEVMHEALIHNWPRLIDWINKDREFQTWLRQIRPNVDLWLSAPTDEGSLLRGGMLVQATNWLAARRDDLSPAEQRFIEASIVLDKRSSGERILLDGAMRSLNLSDLHDEGEIYFARMGKLQQFINLIPTPDIPLWRRIVTLYGEAVGLEKENILKGILEREASARFEAGQQNEPYPDLSIAHATERRGFTLIASTGAQQHAYFVPDMGGSLFGRYFIEALEGRAADEKGNVTIGSAFEYVRQHLRTMKTARNQDPELFVEGDMETFPLTGGRPGLLKTSGKRRALLTTTDQYTDPHMMSLWGQEERMHKTAGILQNAGGFEVLSLLGTAMTRHRLAAAIAELSYQLEENDCLLWYYAGHGGFFGKDSSFYLFLPESSISERWSMLDLREVGDILRKRKNGSSILILDTSFAGASLPFLESSIPSFQ
jgi:energy-coupling factor transporter ATP-binding protein EcfA2